MPLGSWTNQKWSIEDAEEDGHDDGHADERCTPLSAMLMRLRIHGVRLGVNSILLPQL